MHTDNPLPFISLASLAVNAEQKGHFHDAALLWSQARKSAKTRANQAWCKARELWCLQLT